MAEITEPLVLPEDVRMVPVAELSESLRRRLNCAEGDVAMQRFHSRALSKVLGKETAALVEGFRTPRTIAEAVVLYSLPRGLEPSTVLEDAFPVIKQLLTAGLLVPAGSAAVEKVTATLERGDAVDDYQVLATLHVMEDTELYQARAADGACVALKMARAGNEKPGERMLAHEGQVLDALAGQAAPRLVGRGVFDARGYLVLEWIAGIDVEAAAAERRTGIDCAGLGALCLAVLETYADLHRRGGIHGDIHPNNILVDGAGRVRLIDFGLSRMETQAGVLPEPYRGGVAFYYEPEFARAMRDHTLPPPLSPPGEQYSLAVLLYALLTGYHYLDFSLVRDEMMRQIIEDLPLPFAHHGVPAWPGVEQVLRRALSKDAAARYASADEFSAAFRAALEAEPRSGEQTSMERHSTAIPARVEAPGTGLLQQVLARAGWDGDWFTGGVAKAPTASVHSGAAGIATLLYRLALNRGDARLLALADIWAARAEHAIGTDQAFNNPAIDVTPETVGEISPYHTASGVYAVQSLIAQAQGSRAGQEIALRGFVQAAGRTCDTLDVTLGQAGLLVAGALLRESLVDKTQAERTGLDVLCGRALRRIWEVIDAYPPVPDAARLPNLGMAHGWGGLLFATMRWCRAAGLPLPGGVGERLSQLAGLAEPIGRGARWPWQLDHPGLYMPGWCNGSAGYVYLWSLAAGIFGEARYPVLAEQAAWNSWEDPAPTATLCCGLAGRGYALLHWYQRSGDPRWLDRARVLAERAAVNIRAFPDEDLPGYEHSLYKGEVGVAALLADLETPQSAAMPFFEAEGWPEWDTIAPKQLTDN